MTKSAWIMALYDGTRSIKEIAEIVGCSDSYVRTVARQRKGTGQSEADIRYRSSSLYLGGRTRRRSIAGYRAYRAAQKKGAGPALCRALAKEARSLVD